MQRDVIVQRCIDCTCTEAVGNGDEAEDGKVICNREAKECHGCYKNAEGHNPLCADFLDNSFGQKAREDRAR